MKIQIENFGPIHSFEFDLEEDFHIIYGKNNIGKSYAISVVYLLLKNIIKRRNEFLNLFRFLIEDNSRLLFINTITNSIKEKQKSSDNASFSIKEDVQNYVKTIIEKTLIQSVQKSLENSFSDFKNIQNKYSKEDLRITLIFKNCTISIKLNKENNLFISNIKVKSKLNINFSKSNKRSSIKEEESNFYVSPNANDKKIHELLQQVDSWILTFILDSYDEVLKTCNNVFLLPASRSGLYEAMNIFSSVFAKLSQFRHLISDTIEIPALSEPISDYFLNLSTIKEGNSNDKYSNFAIEIEEKILNAQIRFNQDSKKLEYFNKKANFKLDLSDTSSMISEIAPIVAYLKYIVNEKEGTNPSKILFIEEPEAHLHPEIQVELMNIFAKLTQNKVKIVLTTHSNYFFNKVNNLIISGQVEIEKVSNYHLINTNKGSIINKNVELTEAGIIDSNFVEIAEQLYKERLASIETF
ncbi:MAG: AAA family ATPase [Saprospiraceae bacterium]